jgi:hypothetical protein
MATNKLAPISEVQFQQQLKALEKKVVHHADPSAEAQYFNSAGDLCATAARPKLALRFYGDSVNTYLKIGRYDAAVAVCRKLLRASPGVVRTHCTLAWIAIGRGLLADAQAHVGSYTDAAIRAGCEALAIMQVRRMADAVADLATRAFFGEQLLALGDGRTADHLLGTVNRQRNGLPGVTPSDPWPLATAIRAALANTKQAKLN